MSAIVERVKNEPALLSGAIQAVLGLLLAFGVDLSNEQTGAIMVVTAAILAFITRAAVVPVNRLEGPDDGYVDEEGAVRDPVVAILVIILVVVLFIALVVSGVLGVKL